MKYLIGFIVVFAIGGAIVGLANGGKLKDMAQGAATGGAVGFGCLLQFVFAAIPVIIGLVIIGLVMRSCH